MSTQILNFKKVEIVAANVEEAKAIMEENHFNYLGDATQKFKNWKEKQGGAVTDRDIKAFMLDYLNDKTKNCPGAGFLITLDAAVKDTRERPYKIEKVKNEGRRKYTTTYVGVNTATGLPVGKWDTTKADALNAIKEMYKSGELKDNVELSMVKEVSKGEAVVAKCFYTPSKNTKKGTWLAFGIERD